jgi:hypothetical protein
MASKIVINLDTSKDNYLKGLMNVGSFYFKERGVIWKVKF